MSKIAIALAAALIAGSTFATEASAGGVRLGFGFPLGSFVARPYQSSSLHSSSAYERKCQREKLAAMRRARTAKKQELAQAAAARKAAEVKAAKAAEVKTAKVESKTVVADAPVVYVPETPAAKEKEVTIPTTTTASVAPETAPAATDVKVDGTSSEKIEKVAVEQPKKTEDVASNAKRICRKFSAVIGGLVDIPCE